MVLQFLLGTLNFVGFLIVLRFVEQCFYCAYPITELFCGVESLLRYAAGKSCRISALCHCV